jgi:DNA polymerase
MSALRGRIHYWNNIPIIPTYHPAYILRNMTKGEVFIRDLEKVAQYINP